MSHRADEAHDLLGEHCPLESGAPAAPGEWHQRLQQCSTIRAEAQPVVSDDEEPCEPGERWRFQEIGGEYGYSQQSSGLGRDVSGSLTALALERESSRRRSASDVSCCPMLHACVLCGRVVGRMSVGPPSGAPR